VSEKFLARHTTASLYTLLKEGKRPVVALVPIGSTEPHGPHLGLGTDVVIGVTDCAVGFPGAISIPADILTAYVAAICDGLLAQGLRHVCLVNNHLEPAHDTAIRAVLPGREGKVSVACPLTKKWAKTLSAEFKSGACHAGQYETSIVMAAAPELVDEAMRATLAPVPVSLSEKLKEGVTTFTAMGMELAYAGNPAAASVEEGDQLINRLADMVIGEVREALGLPT